MTSFFLAALVVVSTAWAEAPATAPVTPGVGGDPWSICYADVDRFCPGTAKNEGSTIRCLIPNEAKLSAECRKFFVGRKHEALKDWPCAEDAEKLCKNAPNEPGAVGSCLLKKRDLLSPKCREFHDQAALKLKEHQKRVQQSGGRNVTPDGLPAPGSRLPVPK